MAFQVEITPITEAQIEQASRDLSNKGEALILRGLKPSILVKKSQYKRSGL
jgi:hypothetical protein